MTKFNLTVEELVEGVEATVVGTCTYSTNSRKAVEDAAFEIIAKAIEQHSGVRFNYDGVLLTLLAEKVADEMDVDLVWETFWETTSGSGVGLCETCGWWSEEVYNTNELGDVCNECEEEED